MPTYYPIMAAAASFIAMMCTMFATMISEYWIKPRRDRRGFARLLYGELVGYKKYFDGTFVGRLKKIQDAEREDRVTFFSIVGSPNLQGNTIFDKIADKLGLFDDDVLYHIAFLYHSMEGFKIRLQNLSRQAFLQASDTIHLKEIELLIDICEDNKAMYDSLLASLGKIIAK